MSTPHISAREGDFAKTVLMPGDPLRSQFIAENYLEDKRLVNNIRGVQGYTGTYKGVPVSVMASGMGMPSIGIYSYELFSYYGVENILRVGTIGGMREDLHIGSILLGEGACTNGGFGSQYGVQGVFAPIADFTLLRHAAEIAEARGYEYHVGNIFSSDVFYNDDPNVTANWMKLGVLGVEMEAAALYMNAARTGKRALAVCTVSDNLITGENADPEERQTAYRDMMELSLEIAVRMN